jgi:hypothetical protein
MSTENTNQFTQQPPATVEAWRPGTGLFGLGLGNLRNPSIPARGYAGEINGQEGYIEEYTTLDGRKHKRIIRDPGKTEEWFGTNPAAAAERAEKDRKDQEKERQERRAQERLEREQRERDRDRAERGEDRADLRGYRTLSEGRLARGQELGHEIDKGNLKISGYGAVTDRLRTTGDVTAGLMGAQTDQFRAKGEVVYNLGILGLKQGEFDYGKQKDAYTAYVDNMKYYAGQLDRSHRERLEGIGSMGRNLAMAFSGRVPPI